MFYPPQTPTPATRAVTQIWAGLDRRTRPPDGAFQAMENLSSDGYPALTPRPPRRLAFAGTGPVRGIAYRDGLLLTVVGQTLYINGAPLPDFPLPSGAPHPAYPNYGPACPCQIVSMGAWAVFFPDKKYVNLLEYLTPDRPTAELQDKGSLENAANLTPTAASPVTYTLCNREGVPYTLPGTKPAAPEEGDLWMDGSTLKTWAAGRWEEIPQVYVKLSGKNIGKGFAQYDGVSLRLTGAPLEAGDSLPSSAVLEQVGEDFLVVPGVVTGTRTQTAGQVYVARETPDLDYLVSCGNRLWGCRYGFEFDPDLGVSRPVNEIYASALGDFKNWNQFRGLSTDSYAAARGGEGPFTGAVNYQGKPLFFRASALETVYPSESGAHQITVTPCRGCIPGTLAVVDELLYYCTGREVVAYDGAYPRTVSQALGPLRGAAGSAGSLGGKYYLYLPNEGLLVLDTAQGLWHREDMAGAGAFGGDGAKLYYALGEAVYESRGGEDPVAWYGETGPLGLDLPGSKYISRLLLRLQLEPGSYIDVYTAADEGPWEHKGHLEGGNRLRSQFLPILPRRCDTLRLRLEGRGPCRIYSLAKTIEEGSDLW